MSKPSNSERESTSGELRERWEALERVFFPMLGLASLAGLAVALAGYDAGLILLLAGLMLALRFLLMLMVERKFSVDLLMSIVALLTLRYGLILEGLLITLLYSIAELVEHAVERLAERRLERLELVPSKALRRGPRGWEEVPVEELRPGDEILVRVGEAFPVDAVARTRGQVDLSIVTGESDPIPLLPGVRVPSGAIVVEGPVVAVVAAPASDSYAQRLVREAREALERRPRITRLLERYTPHLTLAVLAGYALAHQLVDPVRGLSLLLAGCPSAYIISSSLNASLLIASIARTGGLVRGGEALERGARLDVFILDKTGTLTRPRVVPPESLGEEERRLLNLAVAVARASSHPVARALALLPVGINGARVQSVRELRGRGLEAVVGGETIRISGGSSGCGKTVVVESSRGGRLELCVREELDPWAGRLVEALRARGLRVVIASGDRREPVERVARLLGADEYYYGMKPEDKARLVEKLQERGLRVGFAGDGVNDSLAIARADFSVAVGSISLTTSLADAVAPGGARHVLEILRASWRYRAMLAGSFATATVIKVLVAVLGLAGVLPLPLVALLGDDGSTIAASAVGALLSRRG